MSCLQQNHANVCHDFGSQSISFPDVLGVAYYISWPESQPAAISLFSQWWAHSSFHDLDRL